MVRSAGRSLGFASFAVPFLLVGGLAACTGGESDASPSTVPRIGATNYVTQPVVTLPPSTQPGQTTPPGGTAGAEQEYRVRNGDTVSGIAHRFRITTQQLASYNGWAGPGHLIIQGDIVKIPPFAEVPGESESTVAETLFIEGPICPDGTEQETYEIEDGDYLGRVAEKLDVTVEDLNAANEVTAGYEIFYEGLEILVPCPGGDGSDGDTVPDSTG